MISWEKNLKHLVTLVDELKQKEVGLKVITGQGAQIDTTTFHGKMVFGMFAALAGFERELIVERTKVGLIAARARGRLGGRPLKMDNVPSQWQWLPCLILNQMLLKLLSV